METKEKKLQVLYTKEEGGVFYRTTLTEAEIAEVIKTGIIQKPKVHKRRKPDPIKPAYLEWKLGNWDFIAGKPRLAKMSKDQLPKPYPRNARNTNKVIRSKGEAPKIPSLAEMLKNPPTFNLRVDYTKN